MAGERLICLYCADEERAQGISQKLAEAEITATLCHSSEDLYRLAQASPINAIVIEQDLCGFFTGLDLLAKLEEDLIRPAMIVIGDLDEVEKQKAAELRISATVPANASDDTIVAAVRAALEKAGSGGLNISHAARMLVKDADCIKPLPQLIVRLAAYLSDPEASIANLAKELSADARVTADLLKLVNSAAIGLTAKVNRIQDAVSLIGIKRTISLVISAHLLKSNTRVLDGLPQILEQKLRLRSILTASGAATYATMTGQKAPDMAHVLALLQDLGVQVMCYRLGKSYQQIYERCSAVAQLKLVGYERDQLGFTHADVTAALLEKWDLPPVFVKLALEHHTPITPGQFPPAETELLEAMQFGELLADLREQTSGSRTIQFQRQVVKWGRMDGAGLRVCLMKSVERTQELGQLFNVQTPDQKVMKQLITDLAAEAEVDMPDTPAKARRAEAPVAVG